MLPHLNFADLIALPLDPKAPPRSDVALAHEMAALAPSHCRRHGRSAARFDAIGWDKLLAAMPSLKERAKTLAELLAGALFLVADHAVKTR